MMWIINAIKELFTKKNKEENTMQKRELEVPKPPAQYTANNPVVLNDEEIKYVPESDKNTYMELKTKYPDLAEDLLQRYKEKQDKYELTQGEYLILQYVQEISRDIKHLLQKTK